MTDASSCTDPVFEADVIDSSVIDEGVFQRSTQARWKNDCGPSP